MFTVLLLICARIRWVASVAALLAAGDISCGEAELADVFGDHMVLQADAPITVWGTAEPGEELTVAIASANATTKAGANGRWQVTLDALPAGGPHTLRAGAVTLRDVLIGEVWVCSGQSNMAWPVARSNNAEAELEAANHPGMRVYEVAMTPSGEPRASGGGRWRVVSPKSIAEFSAVGYFFGRSLHETLETPVGVIDASWGGTRIESWMPPEALADAGFKRTADESRRGLAELAARPAGGRAEERPILKDTGIAKPHWAEPTYSHRAWGRIDLPRAFDSDGADLNGAIWFRRFVNLTPEQAHSGGTLSLGPIDDYDVTYVNGERVGHTGPDVPQAWSKPRAYRIEPGGFKPGPNLIAVRVFDRYGGGGFDGVRRDMTITLESRQAVPLSGGWRVAWERAVAADVSPRRQAHHVPGALYMGMIEPLTPMTVRGFTWYQGESNAAEPETYRPLLTEMINHWRESFTGRNQPFYVVQLANFRGRSERRGSKLAWTGLRAAQQAVADNVAGVGLVVTIDVGDSDDIHPRNKQAVGRRLARLALHDIYGLEIEAVGPRLRAVTRAEDAHAVKLHFDHATGKLKLRGGEAELDRAFAVGDAEGRFTWAKPELIDPNSLRLRYKGIDRPTVVRYAWEQNPPAVLFSAAGLPAPPFEYEINQSSE